MNCKKRTQRISHEWGKQNDSNYDGNCTSTSPPDRDLEKNQRSLYVCLSVQILSDMTTKNVMETKRKEQTSNCY
jgi:hypothetical protein